MRVKLLIFIMLMTAVLGAERSVSLQEVVEAALQNNDDLAATNDLLNVSLLKQSSEIALLQDQIKLIKYKSDLKKLLNLKSDEELKQLLINR